MAERRCFLHIGLHKTGTTYVQQLMRANRATLRAQGVLYPGGKDSPSQVFAVWDLLGRRPRGSGNDGRITGAWQTLVDGVRAGQDSTVLISDEHLSLASARQVRSAVAAFPEHEVHVLVTVRDLARTVGSAWQEEVKNRGDWAWADFAAAVQNPQRAGANPARGFWARQDLPAILATWAQHVPVQRIHVLTVPPPGSPPGVLVERLADVVGVDPATLTEEAPWANETVGLVGTELIRRLNPLLQRLNQRQFDKVMKLTMVRLMAEHVPLVRLGLPAADLEWAQATGARMVADIRAAGYPVVGDLTDLDRVSTSGRLPDEVTDEELLQAALATLGGLAELYATNWWVNRRPDAEVDAGPLARGASTVRAAGFRAKRAAANAADSNPVAAKALAAYLRRRRG